MMPRADNKSICLRVCFAAIALSVGTPGIAAAEMDAGQIGRHIMENMPSVQEDEQERGEKPQPETKPETKEEPEIKGRDISLAVPIKIISVISSELKQEIEALLHKRFYGVSNIKNKELRQVKQEIWAAGVGQKRLLYIAMEVVPGVSGKSDSSLIVHVTPISIRKVYVIDESKRPLPAPVLETTHKAVETVLTSGKVLDLDEIDEILAERLLLNDMQLHVSVEPVDDTHVDLKLAIKALMPTKPTWLFQYDNAGDWSFGRDRLIVAMSRNNTWLSGDKANLMALKSADAKNRDFGRGTYFGRAEYEAPVSAWKLRLAGWASGLHYHQVKKALAKVDANGEALELGVGVIRPFYINRSSSLSTRVDLVEKYTVDRVFETERSSEKNAHSAHVRTVYGRQFNQQAIQLSMGATVGYMDLTPHRQAYAQDQATARANGTYAKFESEGYWLGRFISDGAYDYKVKVRGQRALKNLDSMEKITLGGVNGLRAFAAGEASGDHGYIASGELGWSVVPEVRFSTFYERGQIWKSADPWTGFSGPHTYVLQDVGVATTVFIAGIEAGLTYAHQVGSNRGLTAARLDADNSKQRYRLSGFVTYRY